MLLAQIKQKIACLFDIFYFVSVKSELTAFNEQIANIAAILKVFSNAKIKVGGYTVNTGTLATNIKVSIDRAKFVPAH